MRIEDVAFGIDLDRILGVPRVLSAERRHRAGLRAIDASIALPGTSCTRNAGHRVLFIRLDRDSRPLSGGRCGEFSVFRLSQV